MDIYLIAEKLEVLNCLLLGLGFLVFKAVQVVGHRQVHDGDLLVAFAWSVLHICFQHLLNVTLGQLIVNFT